MTDLGPYMEPVEFAWGEASKLKHSFIRAADELEDQISRRNAYGRHALKDWRGKYAKEFEGEHMAITAGDARKIAAECRRCAEQIEQLAQLAREEQERRDIAKEWKIKHDEWEREQSNDGIVEDAGDFFGGDDEPKPPDLPEIKPHPLVAREPPVAGRG